MKFRYAGITTGFAYIFSLSLLAGCGAGTGFPSLGPRFQPIDTKVALMQPDSGVSGSMLRCRTGGGVARFGQKWLGYPETAFRLAAQGRVNVTLKPVRGSGNLTLQAFFDKEGQRMLFCPVIDGPPTTRVSCTSIYALEEDLQMGIKRTFDIPNALRGGSISCAYDDKNLRKL